MYTVYYEPDGKVETAVGRTYSSFKWALRFAVKQTGYVDITYRGNQPYTEWYHPQVSNSGFRMLNGESYTLDALPDWMCPV
jgi:hypothetical protein